MRLRTSAMTMMGTAGAMLAAALATSSVSAAGATVGAVVQPRECPGNYVENTTLVNPEDPSFFDAIDKNDDGVVCIKEWGYPDGDPEVGFIVLDNQAGTSDNVAAFAGRPVGSCPGDRWVLADAPPQDGVGLFGRRNVHDANGDRLSCYLDADGRGVVVDNRVRS